MALALTTGQTVDDIDAFNIQKSVLGKIGNCCQDLFSPESFEDSFYNQSETKSNGFFDGLSSLYKAKIRRSDQCSELLLESDSGSKIKQYPEVSALNSNIDRYINYGEEIYDPDIPVGPSADILKDAKELVMDFVTNRIIPFRITPSIEEGLCLAFRKDNVLAYLELYNDGEVGLLAEDTRTQETIINCDLTKEDIVLTLLSLLK